MDSPFLIVGWKEWVSLPELALPAIKAKIDTGAATSSIHAYNIVQLTKNGKKFIEYELHPLQKNKKVIIKCLSPLIGHRKVRSSSGKLQTRPVIRTSIKIGEFTWTIDVNLTNRDSMGMRMLIGREALAGRVLVNPTQRFLHGKIGPKKAKELYR